MATTQSFFGKKICKVRSNFMCEKVMEYLLLSEVLKNLIFFSITYQKSWLYNANIKQILNAKL